MNLKIILAICLTGGSISFGAMDPQTVFENPTGRALPGVWWHWMGSQVTREGIAKDLAYFKSVGIGSATIFGMTDICTPWATDLLDAPNQGLTAFTPEWWKLVRYAAEEGRKLGIDIGLHNCPGYTSTGGPWIPPARSMRELAFAQTQVTSSGASAKYQIPKPNPDLTPNARFPIFNPKTMRVEKPRMEIRRTDMREIALLAYPAGKKTLRPAEVLDLTASFDAKQNLLTHSLPKGEWILLRVCHIPMGSFIQPCQYKNFGLECDKMNAEAVSLHLDHVIGDLKQHLGKELGTGLRHILLDSYEAGTPNWTPRMREEFAKRRGYGLTPYLPTFVGATIESPEKTQRFQNDFKRTVADLYRDVLFKIMHEKLQAVGVEFNCEPYTGPFETAEVIRHVDRPMTEFWADRTLPKQLPEPLGWDQFKGPNGKRHNIIEAEAFTGPPEVSQWDETPMLLKRIGDQQFLRGINRMVLHTLPLQPWGEDVLPGVVMGRWGTHFGRTQTWATEGKAWFTYLARCQALLQWGKPAPKLPIKSDPGSLVGLIGRHSKSRSLYFVVNLRDKPARFSLPLPHSRQQPEWFDPVTGKITKLGIRDRWIPFSLAPYQSGFLVSRERMQGRQKSRLAPCQVQSAQPVLQRVEGPWEVRFDPKRGGPDKRIRWATLQDWSRQEDPGIRFYSGTAVYQTDFRFTGNLQEARVLDLGNICDQLTRVKLNGIDCGVVWCAPWQIELPQGALRKGENTLQLEHTNVWANRLIGDEQEPADCKWVKAPLPGGFYLERYPQWFLKHEKRPSPGRRCLTTWNYFNKDSKLIPSGILGPITIQK